jgi:hypothetical protein
VVPPSEGQRSAVGRTQEVAHPHSTAEAGEPVPRGPWGWEGGCLSGNCGAETRGDFEPQQRVHASLPDSPAAWRSPDRTNRMPEIGTSGRVHQTAPVVTSSQAAAEQPMIDVSALLQLVDWYHARAQRNEQGGSSCVNLEPPLSPPAPEQAKTPDQPVPTVAGPSRRKPRTNPDRSQSRRGRTPHEASGPAGGDA